MNSAQDRCIIKDVSTDGETDQPTGRQVNRLHFMLESNIYIVVSRKDESAGLCLGGGKGVGRYRYLKAQEV